MAKSDTVHQILNAAGEVFAAKGFKSATVREICTKAGVNLAAVNYHFGDKERLYVAAVKDARNALESSAPLPPLPEQGDPESRLAVIIRTLVHRMLNPNVESWRHALLVREFMQPSRACREITQESIVPFIEDLHGVIRELLPTEAPQHTIRQLGFSILAQAAYYRLQDQFVSLLTPEPELEQYFTPGALADHITKFSLAAIRTYQSVDSFCET